MFDLLVDTWRFRVYIAVKKLFVFAFCVCLFVFWRLIVKCGWRGKTEATSEIISFAAFEMIKYFLSLEHFVYKQSRKVFSCLKKQSKSCYNCTSPSTWKNLRTQKNKDRIAGIILIQRYAFFKSSRDLRFLILAFPDALVTLLRHKLWTYIFIPCIWTHMPIKSIFLKTIPHNIYHMIWSTWAQLKKAGGTWKC